MTSLYLGSPRREKKIDHGRKLDFDRLIKNLMMMMMSTSVTTFIQRNNNNAKWVEASHAFYKGTRAQEGYIGMMI